MKKITFIISLTFLLFVVLLIGHDVGDWIKIKSSNPSGVPLHKEARSSMFGRVQNGSKAQIIDLAQDGHWLKIRLEDGREGWIIEKYVEGTTSPPSETPPVVTTEDKSKVWESYASCKEVIDAGKRAAQQNKNFIRVGTWNIRWFPDNTDVDWLACTIAWLNLDILAVQEFRHTDHAKNKIQELKQKLNSNTGGDWKCSLHECGGARDQHVGFLWNKSRLDVSNFKDMREFNPRASATGSACAGRLRPGRSCYVKAKNGGVDFHLISVHLKMGPDDDAQTERIQALNNIDMAVAPLLQTDEDIIIIGDFNTMGNGTQGSAQTEIANLEFICEEESPGFRHLNVTPACTEYYQGRGGWLDHILVNRLMEEVADFTAHVGGYCEVISCADVSGKMPAAYSDLSDHCPVVFVINNIDIDN